MRRHRAIVQESATRIAEAARGTVTDLSRRLVEDEETFTDRMLGRMAQQMDHFEYKGVVWTAKTLTAHKRNSQETRFGADFIGALEVSFPEYAVKKGFLAQAKKVEPSGYMPPGEFRRMANQCHQMLDLSPASFVFLYSIEGIWIVPASSVAHSRPCNPHDLYSLDISRFFEQHFECFFGDGRIYAADIRALEKLHAIREVQNLHLLHLKVEETQLNLITEEERLE